MSDRDEHNAELDRAYWEEEIEPMEFEPDINDVADWLSEQDGDVLADFMEDLKKRIRENRDATIYVMLADWLDDHYNEIREFIN